MDEELYQKYLESAVHFLSFRMRSEKEVRDNLTKKKATQDIIDRVIAWLKAQRFINDTEFARQSMESRARSKQKSLYVIKMELRKKGVSQEIIDTVAIDPETLIGSDLERAKKLVEKKIKKYKGLEKKELYQRLGGVLARNGFDWSIIKKVIDEVSESTI